MTLARHLSFIDLSFEFQVCFLYRLYRWMLIFQMDEQKQTVISKYLCCVNLFAVGLDAIYARAGNMSN